MGVDVDVEHDRSYFPLPDESAFMRFAYLSTSRCIANNSTREKSKKIASPVA